MLCSSSCSDFCDIALLSLIWDLGPNYDIEIENIRGLRCDGVVEYAFEAVGEIIRGGDVSTVQGAEYDNAYAKTTFKPSHRASCMTEL